MKNKPPQNENRLIPTIVIYMLIPFLSSWLQRLLPGNLPSAVAHFPCVSKLLLSSLGDFLAIPGAVKSPHRLPCIKLLPPSICVVDDGAF